MVARYTATTSLLFFYFRFQVSAILYVYKEPLGMTRSERGFAVEKISLFFFLF